jgi:hypothetical protein
MAISCDVMLLYVSVAVLVTTGGDTTCPPCSSSSSSPDNESSAHMDLLEIDQQLSDTLSGNPLPHPVIVVSSSSANKGAKKSVAADHTTDDHRNQSSRVSSIRASLAGLLASLERRVEAEDPVATGGVRRQANFVVVVVVTWSARTPGGHTQPLRSATSVRVADVTEAD